jgi:hypothetical protein
MGQLKAFIIILFALVLFPLQSLFECTVYAQDSEEKKSAGPVIITATIVAVAVGGGAYAFYYFRNKKKDRLYGDSIIALVNTTLDTASAFLTDKNYIKAGELFRKTLPLWKDYERYCVKRNSSQKMSRESILLKIEDAEVLAAIASEVAVNEEIMNSLPYTEDEFVGFKRNDMKAIVLRTQQTINQIKLQHQGKENTVEFGFRNVLHDLSRIDSLFNAVYNQERLNFSLKCKFNYNQVVDSKDILLLQQFVDDCDYYKIDKEWCNKARQTLNPEIIIAKQSVIAQIPAKTKKIKEKKVRISPVDSMHNAFKEVINSRNITLLEGYAKKYDKSKFRKSESKIDSIYKVMDILKKEQAAARFYALSHPLFSDNPSNRLQIIINGLDNVQSDIFKNAIDSSIGNLKNIPGLRYPATIVVDYSRNPSTIFLSAYSDFRKDAKKDAAPSEWTYSHPGIVQSMHFLNKICQDVNLSSATASNQQFRDKLKKTVFIVRCKKDDEHYLTMYSFPSVKSEGQLEFYNFYDLSSKSMRDKRFTGRKSDTLFVNQSDSLQMELVNNLYR